MQTARIEQVQKQTVIDCPGPGSAACEINWRHLQEGLTAAQVTEWLGEPTQQSGPDIYVQKIVAEWHYEHKGVVYFENEQLQYVDMPQSFVYPL